MASTEDLQKVLDRLEAERRGRALGVQGADAATIGDWMRWLWKTPGVWTAMRSAAAPPNKVNAEDDAPATTYSRQPLKENEQAPVQREPEPAKWRRIWVTVQNPSDGDTGTIEEAQYAVAGDEVLVADLDGHTMGARRLGPHDNPAVVARRFLRERRPKRSAKLVFPNMGVA